MPGNKFNADDLKAGIRALAREWGPAAVMEEAWKPALQLLKFAKNSPVPRGRYAGGGGLASSGVVEQRSASRIRIGFNKIYANFQDAGDRSGFQIVRPTKKKALYIPISSKGRKHVYGANPEKEGLVRGVDFIVLPRGRQVRVPIKGYGSSLGPNHFFSGTLRTKSQWYLLALGLGLQARAARAIRKPQGGTS